MLDWLNGVLGEELEGPKIEVPLAKFHCAGAAGVFHHVGMWFNSGRKTRAPGLTGSGCDCGIAEILQVHRVSSVSCKIQMRARIHEF